MPDRFCQMCGSLLRESLPICKVCRAALTGPMKRAHELYVEMGRRGNRCCGGLNSTRDKLQFHDKEWTGTWPGGGTGPSVTVDMGVNLYSDHARTLLGVRH